MGRTTRGGRGKCVLLLGLLPMVLLALTACDELQGYIPPPQQPPPPPPPTAPPTQPPVVMPPYQPPGVVQPPAVVQPPNVVPPPPPPVIEPPPIQPPEGGPVWVDTISFDPNQVALRAIGGRWFLATPEVTLLAFENDEAGARQALNVIRFYRMNQQCSIGRPTPLLQYYLANGQPPTGPMPGETALPLDLARLDVAQVDNRWMLVQGNVWILDFGLAEMEARAALAVVRSSGFTHICFVGQPQPRMVYFRAGGAGAVLPFVQARLVADPPCYSGPLPATIGFRGWITAAQPCDVQYAFVRSDGGVGPARALRFQQAGVAEVATELPVAQECTGWLALRILSPVLTQSEQAFFEVRPPARPLVQASVIAQPPVYIGRLPALVRFFGRIAVGQPCDVQYAFVRSNGAMGPVQTLRFVQRGAQHVTDDWALHHDYVGWAAIRILSPVDMTSDPAPFEVRSGGHRRIQVSLAADPALYSGPLPAAIDFRGLIAVSHPCEVQYLFVRSDGTFSPVQRLRFDRPGAREVSTRWLVAREGAGWMTLRVVAPAPVESEQATFEVRPAAQPHVRATLNAFPEVHPGPLPATVRFRGTIWAGQPCDVSYVFLRSNGQTGPVQTLRFLQRGARQVEDSWTLHQAFVGWEAIRILAPVRAESERAAFAVKPQGPPPLAIEATLQAVPPVYKGPVPGVIAFRGTLRATQPCDVRYVFVYSDGTQSTPRVLRFARPGEQQVEETRQFLVDAKGWAVLKVLAPVVAASPQAPFEANVRHEMKLNARLKVEPPKYRGLAPAKLRFLGTLHANQACDVRYAFVYSDGAQSQPRLARFAREGNQDVEDAREFTASGRGWAMLRILAPVALESDRADYEVGIVELPALQVRAELKANPSKYRGDPPADIRFKGTIHVNQACEVRYTFERSDGQRVLPRTLRFDKAGAEDVELNLRIPTEGTGWVTLKVLAPVAAESERADFEIEFPKPKEKEKPKEKVKVWADLEAEPPKYQGPGPADVQFKGTIRVDQPCVVQYTFVRSDGGQTPPRLLRFGAAGAKAVEFPLRFAQDARGWVQLLVLAPERQESKKANYSVDIQAPEMPKEKEKPKGKDEPEPEAVNVQATLTAEPAKYAGKLPVTIKLKGNIRVTGQCRLTYVFVQSDGTVSKEYSLRFNKADDKDVSDNWRVEQEMAGWAMIRVLEPVKTESNKAAFEVKRAGR